jgi:hypothetical protein
MEPGMMGLERIGANLIRHILPAGRPRGAGPAGIRANLKGDIS